MSFERSPTYQTWQNMKYRCTNPAAKNYHRYGGRGISVCEKWLNSFEAFLADMGEKPAGMSIDRINNDGNYEPGNCRWADNRTQDRNKCTSVFLEHGGERLCVTDWANRIGVNARTIFNRIQRGWPTERVLIPAYSQPRNTYVDISSCPACGTTFTKVRIASSVGKRVQTLCPSCGKFRFVIAGEPRAANPKE